MMDGGMMAWMTALGMLGWVLVIALLVTILVALVGLLNRTGSGERPGSPPREGPGETRR